MVMGPDIQGDAARARQEQEATRASARSRAEQTAAELGRVNSPSSGGTKDPMVFLGYDYSEVFGGAPTGPGPYARGKGPKEPKKPSIPALGYLPKLPPAAKGPGIRTMKLSEVAGAYYSWGEGTKDKFLSQLNLAGYDTDNMRDTQLAQLWAGYAAQAAEYYKNGQKVTPWDILAKDMKQREAYMKTPRTVTQTQKSFDLSTRGDAHAIFLQAAQSLLGRDPTKKEIDSFQGVLNDMERANPTITTTKSQYLGDELQSQDATTTGGVKEGARGVLATEDIKADPEYGAYQAATTYFDAMMEMIGG